MRDVLLAFLAQYGSPALFAIAAVASVGLPLPVVLLLIVTGSLIAQQVMDPWWAIGLACAGSIAGDLTGYAIGRWGGGRLLARFSRLLGGEERLKHAEEKVRSWGGMGVFLTRWLLTPLGPWVNLASGISGYSWGRFLLWDTVGNCLCVGIYVTLGWTFSDRVVALDSVLGEAAWAAIGLAAAVFLGWKLVSLLRR
jgi:membrane protein DedA with SNARE-associated domain